MFQAADENEWLCVFVFAITFQPLKNICIQYRNMANTVKKLIGVEIYCQLKKTKQNHW